MPSVDRFDELVLRLYDAASETSLWQDLLADLADHLGAFGAQVLIWDHSSSALGFAAYTGYAPEAEVLYGAHYGGIDPRRLAVEARPAGRLSLCHEQFDEDFVRRSEFYNDFLLPQGGRFLMSTKLAATDGVSAYLSFHRNVRQGCFEQEDARQAERLIPHATRAAGLMLHLSQLQTRSQQLEAALDRVEWGIIVTDASGKVLLANAAADALLAAGDGLCMAKGRLSARLHRDGARLKDLIARTVPAGQTTGAVGGALRIERPRAQGSLNVRSLNVVAAPLTERTSAKFGFDRPLVILFISDPQSDILPSTSVLQDLYGLSPAETAVVVALGNGFTVEQIAEAGAKSLNTVRVQLKSAMAKMGANRQAELIRLALRTAQPK